MSFKRISYCNYSNGDVSIQDDPLKVRHNSSNGQKYVNLPSSKSDKPYSDIQPGQRILPLDLPENYSEVPWFVKADLLLEREHDLHCLITRKLETNISEDADPDLFQEAEELGEALFQLRQQLRDEYNLEPREDTDADHLVRANIKEDRDNIIEKLSEIRDWAKTKCKELREDYGVEVVDRPIFDSIVFEVDGERYTTDAPSSVDGLRRVDDGDSDETNRISEKAEEFVKIRFDTLIGANERFHDWMEEKGYEQIGHVETDHYFEKDGFTVIVPWSAESPDDIQIRN